MRNYATKLSTHLNHRLGVSLGALCLLALVTPEAQALHPGSLGAIAAVTRRHHRGNRPYRPPGKDNGCCSCSSDYKEEADFQMIQDHAVAFLNGEPISLILQNAIESFRDQTSSHQLTDQEVAEYLATQGLCLKQAQAETEPKK